jgi:hypothetical protein
VLRKLHTQIFASFSQKQGPREEGFRALRADLRICGDRNGLPLDHKKLSRKFYQSFQKRVRLKPSNSDLSGTSLPGGESTFGRVDFA